MTSISVSGCTVRQTIKPNLRTKREINVASCKTKPKSMMENLLVKKLINFRKLFELKIPYGTKIVLKKLIFNYGCTVW